MAAIWAGRTAGGAARIVVLDGANRLGAKILVAGGGRCNVTHDVVDERAFAGSTRAAIRKVLRGFDANDTVAFFRDLGVGLKCEPGGKLFPVTDRARTVLDALLGAARDAGIELRHPWRVDRIAAADDGPFRIEGPAGALDADRVVLATGGRSLPKTGSDGGGYALARALGHSITGRVFPALVPLRLPGDHFLCDNKGIAVDVAVEVRAGTGKVLARFDGALLCTHFGVSGPVVLDASRYLIDARFDDAEARFVVNWLAPRDFAAVDAMLLAPGRDAVGTALASLLPRRLAGALCVHAGVDPSGPRHALTREARRRLAHELTGMELPISGDRGYAFAEVTAGGVPLGELDLATMESRRRPRLHLCGEICDVDGRIGGYNFQWAWASGHLAGVACGAAIPAGPP